MSADNYYVVRKHPLGGYTYVMAFASDDDPDLLVGVRHPQFITLGEAYDAANQEYSEYGVTLHEEVVQEWLDGVTIVAGAGGG